MSGVRLHVSSQFDEMPCSLGLVRIGSLGRYLAEKIRRAATGVLPQCGPKRQPAGRGARRVWRELRNWAVLLGSLLKTCLGLVCCCMLGCLGLPHNLA